MYLSGCERAVVARDRGFPTAGLRELLPLAELDAYGRRILDGAAAQFGLFGLARTTIDDIAKRAGVSRITIYRRFGGRGGVATELLHREVHALLDLLDEIDTEDPVQDLVDGLVVTLRFVREHPLAQRLLETEQESLLPLVTVDGAPLLALARAYVAGRLVAQVPPGTDPAAVEQASEVVVRIAHSLALTPAGVVDPADHEAFSAFVRRWISPILGSIVTPIVTPTVTPTVTPAREASR